MYTGAALVTMLLAVGSGPLQAVPLQPGYERVIRDPFTLLEVPQKDRATCPRFFVHSAGEVRAFQAGTNQPSWEVPLTFLDPPRIVSADERSVIFATRFCLTTVIANTGTVRWRHGGKPPRADDRDTDPEDFPTLRYVVASGDTLVVVRSDGHLQVLDATTGEVRYTLRPSETIVVSPAVSERMVALLLRSGATTRLAVYPTDEAEPVNVLTLPADLTVSSAIWVQDSLVVVSPTGMLSYGAKSGRLQWSHRFDRLLPVESLVFDAGALYVPLKNAAVGKIDLEVGQAQWQSRLPVLDRSHQVRLQACAGTVVVRSGSLVFLLDANTGRLQNLPEEVLGMRVERAFLAPGQAVFAGRDADLREPMVWSLVEGLKTPEVQPGGSFAREVDWETGQLLGKTVVVRAGNKIYGIRLPER